MPRYQKNRTSRKTQTREKQVVSNSKRLALENKTSQTAISTENTSSLEIAEPEGAVEVIHWIPATAGSVIQIPGGQGSQQFSIQLHEDGRVVDLPVFHSDTVCRAI